MKKNYSIPVLRSVNNAHNVITAAAATTSPVPSCAQLCEKTGISQRLRVIRKQLEGLFSGYSPAFGDAVHEILGKTESNTQAMLQAWRRIGHNDAFRNPRVDLLRANESTMSPMGVACLISYARGYLDCLETVEAAAMAVDTATAPQEPQLIAQTSDEDPHPNLTPHPAKRPQSPTGQTCLPSHRPPSPDASDSGDR